MQAASKRKTIYLVAAIGSLIVAALAFAGVLLPSDTVGRMIFGVVWAMMSVLWFGWYVGGFSGSR